MGLRRWRALCDSHHAAQRPALADDHGLEYSTKWEARSWSEPAAGAPPGRGGAGLAHGGDAGGLYDKGYERHVPQ